MLAALVVLVYLRRLNLVYVDWFILFDWLTDQLIDQLIDWLMDGLIDGWIDWLTDWLIDWLIDWLTDWLIDWLIDWSIDRLTQFESAKKFCRWLQQFVCQCQHVWERSTCWWVMATVRIYWVVWPTAILDWSMFHLSTSMRICTILLSSRTASPSQVIMRRCVLH